MDDEQSVSISSDQNDNLQDKLRDLRKKYNEAIFKLRTAERPATNKNDTTNLDGIILSLREFASSLNNDKISLAADLETEKLKLADANKMIAELRHEIPPHEASVSDGVEDQQEIMQIR